MTQTARGSVTLAVLLLLVAATARADRWIIPAGAHNTGAESTVWRTDLRMVNPTDEQVAVTVYLLKQRRDNTALDTSALYTVPAMGQVVVGDIFESAFGFSGSGALLVDCIEPHLVVTSRTYNLLGDGSTYGQFIPGVPAADALHDGVDGQIIYLVKSADYRSNLGYAAASDQAGSVTVQIYGADGTLLGSKTRSFAGFEQYQFNDVFAAAGAPATPVARAVVRTTAPIVAYGSVVDNRTGDPVAIIAEGAGDAATSLVIAAAARATGTHHSLWRTDVRVFNPNSHPAAVTLVYHAKGASAKALSSTTQTVGAHSILSLSDAMMSAFGMSTANGGLEISSDMPVMVFSRTYNQSDTGTFGQSIPGAPLPLALGAGDNRVYDGLSNSGFRSNVGFLNLDGSPVRLTLTLTDGGGDVGGSGTFDLGPGEMNQIDDVFSYLGVSGTRVGGWWLGIEGDGNVASYVSVADNLSNDPIFDGGVQIAGAAPPGPTPTPTSPPATPTPTPTSPPTTPTPTPTSPPAGACVSVPALADGSRFNVDTTAVINGSTFTGSGVVDVVSTTATGDDRDSHYELQPLNMVIDISQQRQFHVEGEFRVLEQNHTYTALTLNGASQPGYPSEVTTDYDPARVDEPTSFCTGATWQVPSVSQTVVTNGGPPIAGMSAAQEGVVHAVDEPVTVPAGTFTTVHTTVTTTSGSDAGAKIETWTDVATGIQVRTEEYDKNGLQTLLTVYTGAAKR